MSVKCRLCGRPFVLGERFNKLVLVELTKYGVEEVVGDDEDFLCADCSNPDLTPVDGRGL